MNFYHDKKPVCTWGGKAVYEYNKENDKDRLYFVFKPDVSYSLPGKIVFFHTNHVTSNPEAINKWSFLNFPQKVFNFRKNEEYIYELNYACKNRWNKESDPIFTTDLTILVYREEDEVKDRLDLLKSLTSEQLEQGEYERLTAEAKNFDLEKFAQDFRAMCQ